MIEVKPVLPPISIPAVLSKYALHVGVPVNELNIAAEESTIIISLKIGKGDFFQVNFFAYVVLGLFLIYFATQNLFR